MDYDDNDFQSQNLHLAGEGSNKFPHVLRPYALPKFEFDDSIQGHLRFDSLVETEVFLGIESNEDNQWIEDFSRGSSGIEFGSNAAESCSISRCNNVWSEATSSESVEMLLKSVGQEEIVPGQAIIERSDACDELGCLVKQMEPSYNHDNGAHSKTAGVAELRPILAPDEIPENVSGLNDDAGAGRLQVEDPLQAQEGGSSLDGSSSAVDPNAVSGKCGLPKTERSVITDNKSNDANQREGDTLVSESLETKTQEDSSASGVPVDNMITSTNNLITSSGDLNNPEALHNINDICAERVGGLLIDNVEGEKLPELSRDVQMDDQNVDGNASQTGACNSENPLTSSSNVVCLGEENAFKISSCKEEEPSILVVKGDSNLLVVEGCSEGVCSRTPAQASNYEDVALVNSTEIGDQSKVNTGGVSPVFVNCDTSFEGHSVEVSNTNAGFCTTLEPKMDSLVQVTFGPSSFVEKRENALESGQQLDSEIVVSNSGASLLSVEDNKISKSGCDGSTDNILEDTSSLTVVCSSAKFLGETHVTGTSKGVHDAIGVLREDLKAEVHVSSSFLGESMHICEVNTVSRQSDVNNFVPEVSVTELEKTELPSDTSNMDYQIGGSLTFDKGVGSPVLGDGSKDSEAAVPLQSDASAMNNSADVALRNTNLPSCEIIDNVPLPSGNHVATDEKQKEVQSSPEPVVDFTHSGKREETSAKKFTEASLSTIAACSQGAVELGLGSESQNSASCNTAGQLLCEIVDQSLSTVGTCSTESESETKAAVANKVSQECSKELEVCPDLHDSTAKEGDGTKAVLEKFRETTIKENYEKVSLNISDTELTTSNCGMIAQPTPLPFEETCGDICEKRQEDSEATAGFGEKKFGEVAKPDIECVALNASVGSTSSAPSDECHAKFCAQEGGSSSAGSDKPTCGPPTIINNTQISQSETKREEGVKGSTDQNVPVSLVIDGDASEIVSVSQWPKGSSALKDDSSFTFKVNSLANLSDREADKRPQPLSSVQFGEVSPIGEGFPSISGLGQVDAKVAQDHSRRSPQVSDGKIVGGGSKGTPERKPRRASVKATRKESAKKGSLVTQTTPVRQHEIGDKSSNVSLGSSGICQLVQSNAMQHYGHVESSTKPCGPHTSSSSLPDLNSSAPPAVVLQPFTDLQQVQLRAQIFVYGALIQGAAPDEAYMISAFGGPDGGRNIWENAWSASIEKLRGQKSLPINPETPLLSNTGARAPEQAIKQSGSKVFSSPVSWVSSKGTPSTIVNPVIPLSSPLWSIPTPSDALQSSGMTRGAIMDYQQALSPLHPYQTPPIRNFVGHSTSWISQVPFRSPWVASPQTSALDTNARFSALPIIETVKLTPVKEQSLPHSSGMKHISPGPMVHSGGPASVFAVSSPLLDMNKVSVSTGEHTADPKPRKRKKIPNSEDPGQIVLQSQTQTEPISAPAVTSHLSTSVSVPSHLSTSVVVTALGGSVSKASTEKFFVPVLPTSSTDQLRRGERDAEERANLSEETLSKVKEARLQAEDAATHAAVAISHCQEMWNQLDKHKNNRLISDVEAKLASASVAVAAAASVAKAAAAAAKVASNAALQAKLMADEALVSSGYGSSSQSNENFLSESGNTMGKATPASILNGEDGINSSSLVILAARETARKRVEAASAASKRAENLDAIIKAAELVAEAVSQAGKVVAMGSPLPLKELVERGPEGYWKAPQISSELVAKSNDVNREVSNLNFAGEGSNIFAKPSMEELPDKKETQTSNPEKSPTSGEMSMPSMEDNVRLADGISHSVQASEKDSRGPKGRKVSDLAKTIGVVPESEIGLRSSSTNIQKENKIKEGSYVEVFKDGDGFKASWFSANVLSLKDGKAYVCYTELSSGEGSGPLKEWVTIEGEGIKAPKLRIARPMTAMRFEGTRKRRRAAMSDHAWSVGDRVDAWIRESWWEGVVTEKSKNDETTLTVHFPAQGETSVVRAWHLRPSLFWKDGGWIGWSSSRENEGSSPEGDMPQEKRLRLGSPAVEEAKGKDKMSNSIDVVESGKPELSRSLDLSANEKVFNIGRNTRDEKRPESFRTTRTGLQEGSRVIFGVPKPGKKRKFMEVSKHYVADQSNKNNEANESVKFAKYLIPQGSGSRGWKNTSRTDLKEKRAAESKPRFLKPGKPPQSFAGRTIHQKDNSLTTATSASDDSILADHMAKTKDSVSHAENASGKHKPMEFGSFSSTDGAAEGPILFSALAIPSDAPTSKRSLSTNARSERANKGKLAPAGGKLAKIEDKFLNGNPAKSTSDAAEPRRSNRRIQPTSRLLEGLQSSLIISKIPSASHDKGHRSQNRSASRGNKHG